MNKKIGLILGFVFVVIGSFFAGNKYGQAKTPVTGQFARANFAGEINGGGIRGGMRAGGGFTSGEILSIDAQSMTLKMQDGGSKIIFYTPNTTVSKMTTGTISDLTIGTQISITGTPNTDGSVSATGVQIRPTMIGQSSKTN